MKLPAAEFSEFSYGYAVTREVEKHLAATGAALTAAPVLPSLLTENIVGYDARLIVVDFAVFLQFKRSFYLSRQHPGCGRQLPCTCTWTHWQSPHYRFKVDTQSNQFVTMRAYEEDIVKKRRKGYSTYAAPEFHLQGDLDGAYLGGNVVSRSVLVAPSTFDNVVPGEHSYSFQPGMRRGRVMSEPVVAYSTTLAEVLDNAARERDFDQSGDSLTLFDLATWAVSQPVASQMRVDVNEDSARDCLSFLADFAGLLGGALVLLGHAE